MTSLRDPFDNVHKKDIKNKQGQVVAQVDYVGWSQSADRLDDVAPEWSFAILGIGPDWVHGRLTIGDRHFENIGYAENAEADWKKEVLKDAASDAFKRCAALAGVARYLYDKDAPSHPVKSTGRGTPPPPRPAARTSTELPEFPDDFGEPTPIARQSKMQADNSECPEHGVTWNGQWGDLWHKTDDGAYCRHPDNVKRERAARR